MKSNVFVLNTNGPSESPRSRVTVCPNWLSLPARRRSPSASSVSTICDRSK